jgi:hypothetical protein
MRGTVGFLNKRGVAMADQPKQIKPKDPKAGATGGKDKQKPPAREQERKTPRYSCF